MTNELLNSAQRVLYQNRFCDQESFDIIVSEVVSDKEDGYKRNIYKLKYPTFSNVEILHSTLKYSFFDQVLTNGSKVLITSIQGVENKDNVNAKISFSRYNINADIVNLPDERVRYCACIFMKNLYVFGGNCDFKGLKTCFRYELKASKWNKTSDM